MEAIITEKIAKIAASSSGIEICRDDLIGCPSITELLELDSVSFMAFICAVEEEFDIEFREDVTYEELDKLSSLVREIERSIKWNI